MPKLFACLIAVSLLAGCSHERSAESDRVSRVRDIHGAAGPWAVAGYRMGERALKELNLPRQSFRIQVTHYAPAQVQYSCIADGVQAATGASVGKLNLKMVPAPDFLVRTKIEDKIEFRELTFMLLPKFIESIKDVPMDKLEEAGKRVASLPDSEIFTIEELNN